MTDATELATIDDDAASLAAIRPEQQRFDENQRAILRQLGIEEATDGDLDLFFHVCRTTGLDPFRKQIYMIGRNTKVTEWVGDDDNRRRVEKWVTKYTIQTGIDGYRRNGREAAKALGDELDFAGPFYTGEDDFTIRDDGTVVQHWREVWPKKSAPYAAKYVITRNGKPITAIAHYDEFVQTYGNNGGPNSMWAKMPRNQLAKCAEALAWRLTYPDDLSGLILEDAAQPTVIDGDTGEVIQEGTAKIVTRRPGKGLSGIQAAKERADAARTVDAVVEPEPEQEAIAAEAAPPADETPAEKTLRQQLNSEILEMFQGAKLGGNKSSERLIVVRAILGKPDIESTKELSDEDLADLRNGLLDRKDDGSLDAAVTDWINAADVATQDES